MPTRRRILSLSAFDCALRGPFDGLFPAWLSAIQTLCKVILRRYLRFNGFSIMNLSLYYSWLSDLSIPILQIGFLFLKQFPAQSSSSGKDLIPNRRKRNDRSRIQVVETHVFLHDGQMIPSTKLASHITKGPHQLIPHVPVERHAVPGKVRIPFLRPGNVGHKGANGLGGQTRFQGLIQGLPYPQSLDILIHIFIISHRSRPQQNGSAAAFLRKVKTTG